MNTAALFFPFDLFGSAGTRAGVELLADAFREMMDDNRRERLPTRARAYNDRLRMREFKFEKLSAYKDWRKRARQTVRRLLSRHDFLLWVTGNHLGVLPVYEELAAVDKQALVIQLDAHLDIYHLSDCTSELSHGNFLLHSTEPLPPIINLGTRELLLPPEYIAGYYQKTFPAAELAVNCDPALRYLRKACRAVDHVFLDIDCDVFDPAFFPAVTQPLPFGLTPQQLLRLLDAVWSDKIAGISISEFDPARDRNDQSLSLLMWLIEYVLLKRYETRS